jgi:micrococcal nuclease
MTRTASTATTTASDVRRSRKRDRRRPLELVALVALLGLALAAPAHAGTTDGLQRARVTRVIDGDTVEARWDGSVRDVRLIGVDTPETVDPRKPVQFYALEASAFTKRHAEGRLVRLEFEGSRKDRYDRTRAYVYLEDGRLLNAELIRQGYGFTYSQVPFSHLEEFRQLERDARAAGRGQWGPAGASTQTPSTALAAFSPDLEHASTDSAETVYGTKTGTKYHRAGCRHLARKSDTTHAEGRGREVSALHRV